MRRLRLYLDSSILGWSLNRGNPDRFTEANKLLQQIAKGKFVGAYSWVNEQEIEAAPEPIAKMLWRKIGEAKLKRVPMRLTKQVDDLAKIYCVKGIVPSNFKNDALHIAVATLWKADALVSYNFEHIVNLQIMVKVNEVNSALTSQSIII